MKKISLMLMLIMLSVLVLGGCVNDDGANQSSNSNKAIGFYTLQEAYDHELIIVEDLQTIANYHNNDETCQEKINEATVRLIKECAAYNERTNKKNPVPDAKAEDYKILKYYGKYNDCYAVIINHPYYDYPAEEIDVWETIGNVKIHYTSYENILIYKSEK